MELKLKDIHSPDIKLELLESNKIIFNDELFFLLELNIGNKSSIGSDIFSVIISSPYALSKIKNSHTKYLIVTENNFKWETILEKIKAIVEGCNSSSWDDSVKKLRIHFNWEYE